MLFKVFAVVSVIFFLGGCPSFAQTEPKDALMQTIMDLIQEQMTSNKNDGKEMDEALIKLIKEVTEFFSSGDDNNKLLEKLKELLMDQDHKPPKPTKPSDIPFNEREVETVLMIIHKLSAESRKHVFPLIIEKLNQRKEFNLIIKDIIYNLKGEEKDMVMKMYTNHLLGTPATKPKEDDHEEPMPDKDVCSKKSEPELSHILKMLKSSSWKNLFKNDYDKYKYSEMIQYIEESSGPIAWAHKLMMLGKDSEWLWKILQQFVYMLEKNQEMRYQLKKYVHENKELYEIMMKAANWFKYQDFEKSSPVVRKIVYIVKDMFPPQKNENKTKELFDNYIYWVDCTFDKQKGMASVLKTIGVLLRNEKWAESIFGHMYDHYPKKINVTLQLMFNGIIRCNRTVEIVKQNLENLLILVTRKGQFCATTTFTMVERNMKTYISSLGSTSNTNDKIWKINIKENNQLLHENVDLSHVPENNEIIYMLYTTNSLA